MHLGLEGLRAWSSSGMRSRHRIGDPRSIRPDDDQAGLKLTAALTAPPSRDLHILGRQPAATQQILRDLPCKNLETLGVFLPPQGPESSDYGRHEVPRPLLACRAERLPACRALRQRNQNVVPLHV